MSVHGSRVFATWVVSTLTGGGLAARLGMKPASVPSGAGWSVVYPIAGGIVDGTILDPNEDATPDIQVTSASYDATQTLWQSDKVRELLLAAVPATLSDGRDVIFVEPTWPDPTLARDEDVTPPVFFCTDRYSFRTAP